MLHVVVGPPASGKSTYVEQNAGVGTPRFDFDAISSTIAGMDVDHDNPPAVAEVVLAMRRGLYGWLLDPETEPAGDVWLINALPSADLIARFAAVGAQFHRIDPGMDECLARAEADGRPAWTADRIRAWYDNPPVLPGDEDPPEPQKEGAPPVHKDFTADIKAADTTDSNGEGVIEAYAAVFGNVDSYGDTIKPGAFTETLAEWKESGNNIPLLYGHDFADPFSNIGVVTEATEDEHGLRITARLDLDNAKAAQVYRLMKEKRLSQMSFAFRTLDAGEVEIDGDWAYELRRLKLYEVSVVPIGANEETEILTVKAATDALATAVKQAANLGVDEREALARRCESTAAELKSGEETPPETTANEPADTINHAHRRFLAARARLLLEGN